MHLTLACVLLAIVPSLAVAQSLGDAARKEQERRRKTQETGAKAQVITEDELSAGRPALASGTAAPRTGSGGAEAGGAGQDAPIGGNEGIPSEDESAGAPGDGASGAVVPHAVDLSDANARREQEDDWRRRMQAARARVERARRAYDSLRELSIVPGMVYVDEQNRPVIGSLEQLRRLTEKARLELEAAQEAVETLEEQARRAGVPPGWLR